MTGALKPYYEIKYYDGAARIARVYTHSGIIETPYLFPVVDPTRQAVSLPILRELGYNALITNAYLYYRRTRGQGGPIHEYLGWNGPIMTDSGGYQVLIYGDVDVDNKTIVEFEKKIGVDIGVILDVPTGSHMSRAEASHALEETFRRAVEALPLIMDSDALWVLPVQGAPYKDLVIQASIRARRYPYHIYALGSPTVLLEQYRYAEILEIVILARLFLHPGKPLHVFGVGHPMIIPFLVAAGADFFDSASYILYARDNRYIIEGGTKRLDELDYFPCSCPVCSRYTPRELMSMPQPERTRLLALHNLYMLAKEIRLVKQAIRENRLYELLEERSRAHPSLYEAFIVLRKYMDQLSKYSPRTKPRGHAVMLYGYESIDNPYVKAFREALGLMTYKCDILLPAYKKPYQEQYFYKIYRMMYDNICFYNPYLGVFPAELDSTFPVFQHEAPIYIDDLMLEKMIEEIMKYHNIVIVLDSWGIKIVNILLKKIVQGEIEINRYHRIEIMEF